MAQYRAKGDAAPPKEERRNSDLDLSIGQVLAATGATTLGAILVKSLDLWGTVLGTATLSICTSIGAVLILRTMRSTGERIKTQIEARSLTARAGQPRTVDLAETGPSPTRVTATATVPLTAGEGATRPLDQAEPIGPGGEGATEYRAKSTSRKRTLTAIVISSVLVFGLTMGVLLLLGGVTGDPGRFIQQPAPETTTIVEDQDTEEGTEPDEHGTEPAPSDAPDETTSGPAAEEPREEDPAETPSRETPTEAPTEEPTGLDDGRGEAEEGRAHDEQVPAEPEAPETAE